MKKQKDIVVRPLRTIQDFSELLSLSDLKVQMGVLGFLQQNLFEYQMNFFKSQLMDWDQLCEYLPDHQKHLYFKKREYICGEYDRVKMEYITPSYYADYDWDYAQKDYTENPNYYQKDRKKYSAANRCFFLVNHNTKELYKVNKRLVDKFKFAYDGNYLVCNYYDSRPYVSFGRFAQCSMCDCQHTIQIKFNLELNCVESFYDDTTYVVTGKCGSWYDSSNEYLRDSFISDEEEVWMTAEEIAKKKMKKRNC
jgi:hypothetical protein